MMMLMMMQPRSQGFCPLSGRETLGTRLDDDDDDDEGDDDNGGGR